MCKFVYLDQLLCDLLFYYYIRQSYNMWLILKIKKENTRGWNQTPLHWNIEVNFGHSFYFIFHKIQVNLSFSDHNSQRPRTS